MMKRACIYLAGPDVFERDPDKTFAALIALCDKYGFDGLVPSDGGLSNGLKLTGATLAQRIYEANIELIRSCDAVIANVAPFRNELEPDSGTVFEIGFATALGKPVAAYNVQGRFQDRVAAVCGREIHNGQPFCKQHGYLIEELGQGMNLMLARSSSLHEDVESAVAALALRFQTAQAA